jgi:hypothetical protein
MATTDRLCSRGFGLFRAHRTIASSAISDTITANTTTRGSRQPDGAFIRSTHRAYLPGLTHLRRQAAQVDVFEDKDLPHISLMSLGQLCDAGCTAHLSAQELVVSNPDTTALYQGLRNRTTGLLTGILTGDNRYQSSQQPCTLHSMRYI